MPPAITQVILFSSSFSPLFALFALLDTFGSGLPSIICAAVAVLSVLALGGFMRLLRNQHAVEGRISNVSARDQDMIAYLVTYLLPFVALGSATWRERGALLIFIGLVAVLYVRASLLYVNPLLALVRYRLFEADLGAGQPVIIISKRRVLPEGVWLKLRTITETVYLEG